MSNSEFRPDRPPVSPAIGGHMLYDKRIEYDEAGQPVFVKAFDIDLLVLPEKAPGMRAELAHEAGMYSYLQQQQFGYIPEAFSYADDTLRIPAYLPENGWHWDVPADTTAATQYAGDVLATLNELRHVAPLQTRHESSTNLFLAKGWPLLLDPEYQAKVLDRVAAFTPHLHPGSVAGAEQLIDILEHSDPTLANEAATVANRPRNQLGHFDARPSNIAWHPREGVRVVDWSWAANTSPHSDSTMFLIDTHKTDFETRNLAEFQTHFSRQHAALFIGYWLARCIAPGPDQTVRFHQFASAATATTLL